jgi:putative intracellular protease/amidase
MEIDAFTLQRGKIVMNLIKKAGFAVFLMCLLGLLALASAPAKAFATESQQAARQSRVLVVMTNHAQYPNRPDTTGLWLTELTHFYEVFHQAGIEMDFASPKGGNVPLGKRSMGGGYSDDNARKLLADQDFTRRLSNTKAARDVNPADYDVIYFTGGQGTMWDFKDDPELKRLAEGIYRNGGIVSAVCHGATALLNLQATDGTPLIANRRVTGFSSLEEFFAGVRSLVPFDLQSEIEQKGAVYEKSWLPFKSYVITDGRIVTGQNPGSTTDLAKAVLEAMEVNFKSAARQ